LILVVKILISINSNIIEKSIKFKDENKINIVNKFKITSNL
jgi:hypothetical protein